LGSLWYLSIKATVFAALQQRVVLNNVSWATYEKLLEDLADSSAPRLTFDRGALEIMSPTFEHERLNRLLASFVEEAAEESDVEVENAGSTTFRRSDLARGFEPEVRVGIVSTTYRRTCRR